MNVAGEIGGSGIRMARPFLRRDSVSQTLIPNFKARTAFEFSGWTPGNRSTDGDLRATMASRIPNAAARPAHNANSPSVHLRACLLRMNTIPALGPRIIGSYSFSRGSPTSLWPDRSTREPIFLQWASVRYLSLYSSFMTHPVAPASRGSLGELHREPPIGQSCPDSPSVCTNRAKGWGVTDVSRQDNRGQGEKSGTHLQCVVAV